MDCSSSARGVGHTSPFWIIRLLILGCFALGRPAAAETHQAVSTVTGALSAYDDGYARGVMRANEGITLADLALIEDDAPGAGYSQKGSHIEPIHRGVLARKILTLKDPSALEAHVVLFMDRLEGPAKEPAPPYYLLVNGHRTEGIPVPWHEGTWHWVKFPVEWLRAGDNEVILGCDASEGAGYNLLVAREDEYDGGGGKYTFNGNTAAVSAGLVNAERQAGDPGLQPIKVGAHSAKSTDGCKTWVRHALGAKGNINGEYAIRLNLKRYQPSGVLRSDAIDLWSGLDGMDSIQPRCMVSGLELTGQGETPEGTGIGWSVRFADTPDLNDPGWGEFQPAGAGENITGRLTPGGKRYAQWQAVLTTRNPLLTPVVRQARVSRQLAFTPPTTNSFYVTACENVRHRYSSYPFGYEDSDQPKLKALRERLGLDQVLEGANGDFERINRLRHHVSGLWYHGLPDPEDPEWDALQILDRKDKLGWGGMCIQFAIVYMQALQACGYTARHVNICYHETVEVYCDELGKWIHEDPESVFDSYEHEIATGRPLNALEQHRYLLKELGFGAANPIDWMNPKPWSWPGNEIKITTQPLQVCTATDWLNDPANLPPQHKLAGFLRIISRNDFLSHPTPRPVNHGLWYTWPWDGYLNWYDEATPRKLQYALHSDREADFYPTLNRVQFTATHGEREGDLQIGMITFTPNFARYEVAVDQNGWQASPAKFNWQLHPGALNTLRMRVVNKAGRTGMESKLQVLWNRREPFQPRAVKPKSNGPQQISRERY